MVLNRNNVYVIMEISMQNLELYLSGTQERGRPGWGPPQFLAELFLLENTIFLSKIPENWYCLKQRWIKNSVLENLGKLTQCTRSLAM